jgi:hypothetical protein
MMGPDGIATVVFPLASINTPFALPTFSLPNATRSGSNEGRVGTGEGVPTTEALVGVDEGVADTAGEDLGEGVAAPQPARAAAPAITSAVRWILIEWFPSCFGECLLNDHPFAWLRD